VKRKRADSRYDRTAAQSQASLPVSNRKHLCGAGQFFFESVYRCSGIFRPMDKL
jgi:hypothetical protein